MPPFPRAGCCDGGGAGMCKSCPGHWRQPRVLEKVTSRGSPPSVLGQLGEMLAAGLAKILHAKMI